MNPRTLLQARRYGAFRYATQFDSTNDTKQMLDGFGLTPEPLLLVEIDRASAVGIVSSLLWKDMVHGIENMPHEQAMQWAKEIIEENSSDSATYYSNRDDREDNRWNPLTNSTFDSGVIIRNQDGLSFCLWFEEED